MMRTLRGVVVAAIVLAGIGIGSAREASAANITITTIYFTDDYNETLINYGGNYSLGSGETFRSFTLWSYGSFGHTYYASGETYGGGSWSATVACDYNASWTTCYAQINYIYGGHNYYYYTSYNLTDPV
jgi:hypothetical protein